MSEKVLYEKRLLERIKNDSDAAFEEIYNRYWKQLFNFGMRKLNQREIVEGIVQEVFIDLWVRRKSISIYESLSSYLHSSVNFRIINQYKSRSIREKYLDTLKAQSPDTSISIEELIQFKDLKLNIKGIIKKFPIQRQKAYKLRFNKGLSYSEIADVMEISVSTVEKHLIRAIKDLRVSLRELTLASGMALLQDPLFFFL
ncbi:RNA polymerase sigma-70 factor [Algoriphagus aestuariicola]|uniref:RNA polymerase sigma-70 factor n=1 Tax=Algoriphagus aestuariicola TaxID=1852016 RepID=A0ABS3BVV1_9BACT|nr:RNA polymerase sigma-70 factor [Algoriphagus aestuariicola]MBN7803243.1 RNA polymerase sigma-70 factor [Algoriphagus aestuariicola]